MREYATIDTHAGTVITEDGQIIPILWARDEDGNDSDLTSAWEIHAGPDANGEYLTIGMDVFSNARTS